MNQATWDAVDHYISDSLVQADPVLESALQSSADAGLPPINVAPNQGKLLHMFALMCGAKRILEIGTLGGYSSIWLARALPADGTLITLEYEPHHAEVAKANLAKAGLSDKVEVRVGAALASLAQLADEAIEPFDLIFIDADKPNNPHYLAWALKFARVGTVIIGDNVVRGGAVTDANNPDPAIQGTRQLFADLAANPKLTATALQTVGSKGYDGFAIAIVQQL
ncbi:O-methyltransferase [Herpetosiphon geysericola]|uniref:Methyltransferase n=1 Tax=Herpetosiphon geysericola TaxID=70996 RepID=A0A0P6XZ19_9CHLR|nr:O-methyltransferase [Herpetosiphon geysericola]KPL85233.1 methyltransferase [Herpetosiphon geysericola]